MKNKKIERSGSKIELLKRQEYIAPQIEVMEIEIEQNVLAGASGDGNLPGMGGEDW